MKKMNLNNDSAIDEQDLDNLEEIYSKEKEKIAINSQSGNIAKPVFVDNGTVDEIVKNSTESEEGARKTSRRVFTNEEKNSFKDSKYEASLNRNRFRTRERKYNNINNVHLPTSSNGTPFVFYILFFIAIAVLFKWVILKSPGMTAVAMFVIILVVIGHLRDK